MIFFLKVYKDRGEWFVWFYFLKNIEDFFSLDILVASDDICFNSIDNE